MEDVTPDGFVRKQVLTEGSGEQPPLHARCLGSDHQGCETIHPTPRASRICCGEACFDRAPKLVCLAVHYVSRLAGTDQVLVDTRDEGGSDPVPIVAGRGTQRIYAVHELVRLSS